MSLAANHRSEGFEALLHLLRCQSEEDSILFSALELNKRLSCDEVMDGS